MRCWVSSLRDRVSPLASNPARPLSGSRKDSNFIDEVEFVVEAPIYCPIDPERINEAASASRKSVTSG
jgi:hypothetical protein